MLSDFMTIEAAMTTELIPKSYHYLFEKYKVCPDNHCNHPIIINSNRTVMKCSNPNCPRILSMRVLKVYNRFGLMNAGAKFAYDWTVNCGLTGIPDALLKAPDTIKNNILAWLSVPHTPGEIIEMTGIPGIGTKSTKMMECVHNYNHFAEMIDVFGRQIVLFKCGIEGKVNPKWWSALVSAVKQGYSWEQLSGFILKNSKYDKLPYDTTQDFMDAVLYEGLSAIFRTTLGGTGRDGENCAESVFLYWEEVKSMFKICKCYPEKIETRKIIITGDITQIVKPDGNTYERQEFIDYINTFSVMAGIRYQNSTAFASSEFVIADYPSGTNKYRRGQAMGNLISSSDFVQLIKKRVKEYEESQQ